MAEECEIKTVKKIIVKDFDGNEREVSMDDYRKLEDIMIRIKMMAMKAIDMNPLTSPRELPYSLQKRYLRLIREFYDLPYEDIKAKSDDLYDDFVFSKPPEELPAKKLISS